MVFYSINNLGINIKKEYLGKMLPKFLACSHLVNFLFLKKSRKKHWVFYFHHTNELGFEN